MAEDIGLVREDIFEFNLLGIVPMVGLARNSLQTGLESGRKRLD